MDKLLVFIVFLSILTTLMLSILMLIKTSKYYLQSLVDKFKKLPVAICIINAHNNEIIDCNKYFCELIKDKEKFKDKNIELINIFENFKDYLDIKSLSKNNNINNKIVKMNINNELKHINIHFSYFKIGLKKIIILFFKDISEEIKSVKYLGVFTSIIENTTDGILISRKNGNKIPEIIYSNSKLTEITGYEKTEILNKPINTIFELNVDESVLNEIKEKTMLMEPTNIEFKYINKNGKEYWLHANIIPISNENIKAALNNTLNSSNNNAIKNYINNLDNADIFITIHQKDITTFKEVESASKHFTDKLESIIEEKIKYNEILSKILQTLIDNNKENAINNTLKILGENLNVDRAFVFSIYNKNNTQYMKYDYEWVKDSIESEINNIAVNNVTFEEIEAYDLYASLVSNKIHKTYTKDLKDLNRKKILERENIKTMIVCPIYDKKQLIGFIGFDDCTNEDRVWDQNLEKLLREISKALPIILIQRS